MLCGNHFVTCMWVYVCITVSACLHDLVFKRLSPKQNTCLYWKLIMLMYALNCLLSQWNGRLAAASVLRMVLCLMLMKIPKLRQSVSGFQSSSTVWSVPLSWLNVVMMVVRRKVSCISLVFNLNCTVLGQQTTIRNQRLLKHGRSLDSLPRNVIQNTRLALELVLAANNLNYGCQVSESNLIQ